MHVNEDIPQSDQTSLVIETLINITTATTSEVLTKADGLTSYANTAEGLNRKTELVREVIEHELIRQFGDIR